MITKNEVKDVREAAERLTKSRWCNSCSMHRPLVQFTQRGVRAKCDPCLSKIKAILAAR